MVYRKIYFFYNIRYDAAIVTIIATEMKNKLGVPPYMYRGTVYAHHTVVVKYDVLRKFTSQMRYIVYYMHIFYMYIYYIVI